MTEDTQSRVLVVEDEKDLADLYAEYLRTQHEVDVAYSGQDAVDMLDDSHDIILLDRRMPVVSGNEVLAHLEEAGHDCRVAMVTAVNPDFDIIDLRIDDYLVKPVTKEEVQDTVSRLLKLDTYNERMRNLTAKKLKRNVLEVEKTGKELEESEEFDQLQTEIEQLEEEIDSIADDLDVENIEEQI